MRVGVSPGEGDRVAVLVTNGPLVCVGVVLGGAAVIVRVAVRVALADGADVIVTVRVGACGVVDGDVVGVTVRV